MYSSSSPPINSPNTSIHALILEIANANTARRGMAIAQLAKRKEAEGREIAEAVWGAFGKD
jgi:hypothetical protein